MKKLTYRTDSGLSARAHDIVFLIKKLLKLKSLSHSSSEGMCDLMEGTSPGGVD